MNTLQGQNKITWRPWPWNLFPDWASVVVSAVILAPAAPIMAVLIGSGEFIWAIILRLCSYTTIHLRVQSFILDYSQVIANKIMRDPRNMNYLPHILWLSIWGPFLFFSSLYRCMNHGFELWFFILIQFLRIGPRFRFFTYVHVLLHKEGHDHKGFFKGSFSVLNNIVTWWIGPFYGGVPNNYCTAHNKIHHRYDNQIGDVHTNLDLDRSKLLSFFKYVPRFGMYWTGFSPLHFFHSKGDYRLFFSQLLGVAYFYGIFLCFFLWSPLFAVGYILYPQVEDVVFFGGISYLWHSFYDPKDPDNQYINSVTVLNGKDNVWNEDYHVVHHTEPRTHWSDYDKHFTNNTDIYRRNKATMFSDTEEGELLFLMLQGNFRRLAELFVDLDNKMTIEEKEELIRYRLSSTINGNEVVLKKGEGKRSI
ncbi:hypothetical protein AKO1_010155 [Acrasis kona]|uniref:Fatty acid desaturase domain-containing protein n=1 Tax=Acrasis kona TaxID=1008807 RepID=A0AAW2ZSJ2_9EUKA